MERLTPPIAPNLNNASFYMDPKIYTFKDYNISGSDLTNLR